MAEMHSPACYVLKVFNDNAITCKLKCGHHPCGEGRFIVSLSCTINCCPKLKNGNQTCSAERFNVYMCTINLKASGHKGEHNAANKMIKQPGCECVKIIYLNIYLFLSSVCS